MVFFKRILALCLLFACATINVKAFEYGELATLIFVASSGAIAASTGVVLATMENKDSPGATSPLAATIGAGLVGTASVYLMIGLSRDSTWSGDASDAALLFLSPFLGGAIGHLAGFTFTKSFWTSFSSLVSGAINKIKGNPKQTSVGIVLPLLKGQSVKDVEESLKAANIKVEILHENPVAHGHQGEGLL